MDHSLVLLNETMRLVMQGHSRQMGHGGEFQQNMIQGEVNHSSILYLRTHKQYEKAKRYDTER